MTSNVIKIDRLVDANAPVNVYTFIAYGKHYRDEMQMKPEFERFKMDPDKAYVLDFKANGEITCCEYDPNIETKV